MGLGLYISRQIAELHGGQIEVDLPADGGTRFVIRLPAGPERVTGSAARA
jgi:signal transduction histidine kinase